MAWNRHAIVQTRSRGRRRGDGAGRPNFDFHTGQAKDTPYTLECYDQDMALPLKREDQLVFRAASDEWPASGEKATLADKEDGNAAYVMSYKFVYGYNLDASGHESDDHQSSSKKKSSNGKVWVGVVLLLVAAMTGALLVGTCCYLYKARSSTAKEPPTITGVEMAHVESTQAIEIKSSDVEQPAAAAAPGRMV